MLIATRVLKLRRTAGDIDIPVRIFAPEQEGASWSCKFEVDWPDGTPRIAAGGVDSVQALHLCLRTYRCAALCERPSRIGQADVA
jgi:hypothetical protein